MQKAAQAYFQAQVTTTSQGDLLIMLYDGAVKFLTQAKERMAARDMAGKGILISKAMDIINELDSSLNADKGGELAVNLHKLYFYCSTRLLNANLKLDPALIDEVIKILTGLRSAYAQIIDTPEAKAAGAAIAARQPASAVMAQRGAALPTPGQDQPMAGITQARAAYAQQAAPANAPAAPVQQQAQQEPQPAATGTPAAEQPTPATPPAGGFAPKGLASGLYRRYAQGG